MVSLAVAEGRMVICCRPAVTEEGPGAALLVVGAHGISPFEVGEPSLHARPELR